MSRRVTRVRCDLPHVVYAGTYLDPATPEDWTGRGTARVLYCPACLGTGYVDVPALDAPDDGPASHGREVEPEPDALAGLRDAVRVEPTRSIDTSPEKIARGGDPE